MEDRKPEQCILCQLLADTRPYNRHGGWNIPPTVQIPPTARFPWMRMHAGGSRPSTDPLFLRYPLGIATTGVVYLAGTRARPRCRTDDREGPSGGVLGCPSKLSPLSIVDDGTRKDCEYLPWKCKSSRNSMSTTHREKTSIYCCPLQEPSLSTKLSERKPFHSRKLLSSIPASGSFMPYLASAARCPTVRRKVSTQT